MNGMDDEAKQQRRERHAELVRAVEAELASFPTETVELSRKLGEESPRGVILIAAQYGDNMVEALLRALCLPVKETKELLGSGTGAALGSFGARIKACWCLGLLPEDEYVNLEQLRKMRNHVAHNLDSVTFDDQKIKGHLAALRIEPFPADDVPIYRLSHVIGTFRSWLRFAEPLIKTRVLARSLSMLGAQAKRTPEQRNPPVMDDLDELDELDAEFGGEEAESGGED